MSTSNPRWALLLLSSVIGQVITVESQQHFSDPTSTEQTITSNSSTPFKSTTPVYYDYMDDSSPLFEISAGKIVILLLLSFSIPVGFMLLLFWRLYKEKKYLNARAGALIYRETVLVPSYGVSNPNSNPNGNYPNVLHMHTALYDRPPNYEDAMNQPSAGGYPTVIENQTSTETKKDKIDDIPPPSYSAVYM